MLLTQQSYKFKFFTKKLAKTPIRYSVNARYRIPSDIEEKKYNIDGIGLYCESSHE